MTAALDDGGRRLFVRELRHPSQATLVRLALYQQRAGFLVTEERIGSARVVGTLGVAPSRETAESLLGARERQLRAQRYEQVGPAGVG